MKIAITGASGFVGSHLAEYLINNRHKVSCLVRKTSNLQWLEHLEYKRILGDITDQDSIVDFVRDQDIIVHSAGLTKARTEEEYLYSNAKSTEMLLESILKNNPNLKRFFLISSQAAAGPTPTESALNENDPIHPITPYGRSKAKAEEITNHFSEKIPVTIIRPPAVFGPREKDIYTYFKLIQRGIQPIMGYENKVSIVHIKNLVYGIELAMSSDKAINQTYYITDDGEYTWTDLAQLISKALNKNPIRLKVPSWIIRLVASINSIYSSTFKKAVLLNKEKILEMKQPYWLVSNEKAKLELGYKPLLSTEEGINETAGWYLEQGWI
jgi:dihydroflavonol-4-reductase